MRARWWLFGTLLLLIAVLQGCATAKKTLLGNLPPETVLAVQAVPPDTLNSVNHRVQLHWYGSDPDGQVVAYEYRFFNDAAPADSAWVYLDCATGDCTDRLFTIYSPGGFTHARFEVRAVDNQGAKDPSPAVETFGLQNVAPRVHFTGGPAPTDSTYASATVSWNVDDLGGDLAGLSFRVFLDGNQANYDSIYTGTSVATYTVPSARFIQGVTSTNPGEWRTGYRKLYVQAVDDGGRVGPLDSLRWFVRAPNNSTLPVTSRGRVLLVDDSFRTSTNNQRVDTLFSNTLVRNLAGAPFSIFRIEFNPGMIRSGRDLAQTFRQFDSVVWYRGYDTFVPTILGTYQDSIGAYLEHGGRFFIEGSNLIDGPQLATIPAPPLRSDFIDKYFDGAVMAKFLSGSFGDSTVAWGNRTNTSIPPTDFRSTALQDSMRLAGLLPSNCTIRAFLPRDTTEVSLWAREGSLEPPNPVQAAVAMNVRQASGGRAMIVAFPIREAIPTYASSSRILAKLLFHPTNGFLAP